MLRLLSGMFFSRILGGILVANVFSLAICNLFRVKVSNVAFIYPVILVAAIVLFFRARTKRFDRKLTTGMVAFTSVYCVIVCLLRLPYVLEWIPGNIVRVAWDDYARLAELISMTLSEQFPLKHPANQEYLFSFYYAALLPFAFLKLIVPLITLKDAIFLGNALYSVLFCFSLLEVSNLLLPSRRSVWVLVLLCTLFGGFDWIVSCMFRLNPLVYHHELWQFNKLTNGNAEVSSFLTGLFWTSHHFIAFYACVLAFVFMARSVLWSKTLKSILVGSLLISALHSSVFSAFPLVLFLGIERRIFLRRFCRWKVIPILGILLVAPLFIYMNRLPGQGFAASTFRFEFTGSFYFDKLFSFPIWLVIVPLVEFGAIPYIALTCVRDFSEKERWYFLAAGLFMVSTYVLAFSGANNYCMRGMFLPTFVFFFLFAKYVPHSRFVFFLNSKLLKPFGGWEQNRLLLIPVGVLLLSFGTVLELGWLFRESVFTNALTWRYLKGQRAAAQRFPVNYREPARDHGTKYRKPYLFERAGHSYYNAEKMIRIPIEYMSRQEKEMLRLPSKTHVKSPAPAAPNLP